MQLLGLDSQIHLFSDSRHTLYASERHAFRQALFTSLKEIRERLHTHGTVSDRHQALDLVVGLLASVILTALDRQPPLTPEILRERAQAEGRPEATLLTQFIQDTLGERLAQAVPNPIDLEPLVPRLDPQDSDLAVELLESMDRLSPFLERWTEDGPQPALFDVVNEVFGQVLADAFSDERQLGQYLTPDEVVQAMVDCVLSDLTEEEYAALLSNDPRENFGPILDPSCGTSSFLTTFLHGLLQSASIRMAPDQQMRWLRRATSELIQGLDRSPRMLRLSLISLSLFGASTVTLQQVNALSRGQNGAPELEQLEGKVGLILTNPPFGAEWPVADVQDYAISGPQTGLGPQRSYPSEVLFLERYLDWLRPGGRLLVVVPDSVLANRGIFEHLRRMIANRACVRAILSLPSVTFGTDGTQTKTSILVLVREPAPTPEHPRYTLCGRCDDLGYQVVTRSSIRVKVPSGTNQLPELIRILHQGPQFPTPPHCRWVENLSEQHRWDAQYHCTLSPQQQRVVDGPLGDGSRIHRFAKLVTERHDPRNGPDDTFSYIEISGLDAKSLHVTARVLHRASAPSRARKQVQTGDVLISTVRPERKTVGVVPTELDGAICTTGLAILRPVGIHPRILARLLQADFVVKQLIRENTGIAYPVFDEHILESVTLPIQRDALNELNDRGARLDAVLGELRVLESATMRSLQAVQETWEESIHLTEGNDPTSA